MHTYPTDGDHYPGEAMLVYPGEDAGVQGPLPSLRLKWIREGVEDYEYIELMKKAGKSDAALELARHPCGFPALERRSETPIRSTKANGRSTG